jgi:hypothetical protein
LKVYYSASHPLELVSESHSSPLDDFSIRVLLPLDGGGGSRGEVDTIHLKAQVLPLPLEIVGESRAGRHRANAIPGTTEYGPSAGRKQRLGTRGNGVEWDDETRCGGGEEFVAT